MSHPYLRLRFRLQAVVTLVDALVGVATLAAHPEAAKQVALADRLVLTKTDLADASTLDALTAQVRALNPGAPLMDVATATAAQLFGGVGFDPAARSETARAWLDAEAIEAHQAHHGHDRHGHHDVNRHDAAIAAFCLRYPRPVSPYAVSLFTELLSSAHGDKVLRLKGLVQTSDDPSRPVVVHGVQHVMSPPCRLESWPDDDHDTRLVFILNNLAPDLVVRLWHAAAGNPQVDTAELAAANPLAPPRGGLLA